ncbi:fimbrial biogenesis outer membrane usher protein [Pigmentiphaga litoralis]|uniref:fimbria/pilus outer membrane usher protein n=1 Tax=Pigmentiphaga litoralis TaxID=516702 RepID=UPI001672AEF8|nr:fimbria/pilus outer membrane usher protein [Pigmentiphaga litoralis]GGX02042.1 fimbrial biogenesis outer membrane usher protein [Pigmentiphaga litoralis]
MPRRLFALLRTRRIALAACAVASGGAFAQPAPGTQPSSTLGADFAPGATRARASGFNSQFLTGSIPPSDLEEFLKGNGVLPRNYWLDVAINRVSAGRHNISFVRDDALGKLVPCLTMSALEDFGVEVNRLRSRGIEQGLEATAPCVDLPRLIPEYQFDYQPNRLLLLLSVPQAWMRPNASRRVDPSKWDAGATVAFTNYSANTRRDWRDNTAPVSNTFVGLRNGVNLGAWRLRNDSNVVSSTFGGTAFSSNRTYVQRDIDALQAQLTLGQLFTDGQVFDSVRIRGMSLRIDESMLPFNERGYTPVVRGIAETNATVEIRQNGYLLSSTPVSPGPFVIDDLYPSGSNGELEITLIEAGGRRRVTRQPFGALPMMVRADALRYHAALGQYDGGTRADARPHPAVFAGTLAWGARENFTAFGGVQASSGFHAINLGGAVNTFWGALSTDLTQSRSNVQGATTSGQSIRLLYNKTFTRTNTNFTLAGYRYSSEGFRTFQNHVDERGLADSVGNGAYAYAAVRMRTSFNVSVYQQLGERLGSVYLSANDQTYWNSSGNRRTLQTGYSNTWGSVAYNFSLSHTSDINASYPGGFSYRAGSDTRAMLTLSAPLGTGRHAPTATSYYSDGNTGGSSMSLGLNGALPVERDIYYSLYANKDTQVATSGSLSGRLPAAQVSASVSQGKGYQSASFTANGVAVAHGGGINFGHSAGETFGLVQIADTRHVGLQGGGTTGANGYGIVPYLVPYARNQVGVDTRKTDSDIEIEQTSQHVVPRRGAVPLIVFKGSTGRRVQFELIASNGIPLPLAASVEDADGRQLGITDVKGRAMLFLQQDKGLLRARWNRNVCEAEYTLPDRDPAKAFQRMKLVCQIRSDNRMQATR